MPYRHLIGFQDFSMAEWNRVIAQALDISTRPQDFYGCCENKIMATLFYEPSTRTQMSFQTAMLRLGGRIIGFDNPSNSSVAKGENLKDTIQVVSGYADILAMRNPVEGSAKAATLFAGCPIINAGDGGHLHPTQTLTDLVTLQKEIGTLDGLTIGLCGDLKYGRTVHSLIQAMSHFNTRFVLISTPQLALPSYLKSMLKSAGCPYTEVFSLEDAIGELDVLYMTRIQRERFSSPEEYEKQKHVYVLDRAKLSLAKKDLKVLHPLPRVDEIDVAVDEDPRALYFQQAIYGVYARMSLILFLLQQAKGSYRPFAGKEIPHELCENENCATHKEPYLPHYFQNHGDMLTCEFCDSRKLI